MDELKNDTERDVASEAIVFDAPMIVDYGDVAKETHASGSGFDDGLGGYS